jgi:hypothetical protein
MMEGKCDDKYLPSGFKEHRKLLDYLRKNLVLRNAP